MTAETKLVKELRDQAAKETKGTDNPFAARKLRVEWRAAERLVELEAFAKAHPGTFQHWKVGVQNEDCK